MGAGYVDVVDFHAHILPGADHGSSSLDTSLAQLKLAKEHGVTRIVATPHFYPHRHTLEKFLARREACASELIDVRQDTDPEVKLGAEVLLCEGLENFEGIERLCIRGTNTILIELPFTDFRSSYCDTVAKLLRRGLDVVLAHVDRYPKNNIEEMLDIGVRKLQLNADSLAKLFKDKHLLSWAKDGYVVSLGSDIHGSDAKAYKRFVKAKDTLSDSIGYIADKSDEIWNKAN